MSAATHAALEQAIEQHFLGELTDDASEERRTAMVINWVVGYTISNVVDVNGESVVGYRNGSFSALGDPNAAAHLAGWVSDDIARVLDGDDD